MFTLKLSFDSTAGIVARLKNLWKIFIPRPQDFGGNLAESKTSSNVIICFWTFSWRENCVWRPDLSVHMKHGVVCNPASWHRIERVLSRKYAYLSWRGNIHTKKTIIYYGGDIRGNTYFYLFRHNGGCSRIGRTETFGEFWICMWRLRISTRVDFKYMWG